MNIRHLAKKGLQVLLLGTLGAAIIGRSCRIRPKPPSKAVTWDRAEEFVGERVAVDGPVVDTHYADADQYGGGPTFLNIGRPHPEKPRFTVVIWEEDRDKFPFPPENFYKGKEIRVAGKVEAYEGIPQITVSRPGAIEVIE